jgi:predicted secreted Zn-dependent protease
VPRLSMLELVSVLGGIAVGWPCLTGAGGTGMRARSRSLGLAALLPGAFIGVAPVSAAGWSAVDRVEPYAIHGRSGIELYRSIGEHGPVAGSGRVIAYTTFRLTWTRKYVNEAGGCRLVSATPHLVIITKLPKPANPLPARTGKLWDTFIAGIRAHERVHGEIIAEMVKKIEATSVGLSMPADPDCRKVHAELTRRLKALSEEQRQRSRDFDRVEMAEGGNVQRLILALVNGDRT